MSEKSITHELEAFQELFPTANLVATTRAELDKQLPRWLEMLNRFEEEPYAYPEVLAFLQKAVLNVDIYNGIPPDLLINPPADKQDTPQIEWQHQIKNLVMRGNVFNGKSNFDFGQFAEAINGFASLSNTQRSLIHIEAINYLMSSVSKIDAESGQLVHQPKEVFKWFGKQRTFASLLTSGLLHEADHSHFTHGLYIELYGGVAPIQNILSGAPLQQRYMQLNS